MAPRVRNGQGQTQRQNGELDYQMSVATRDTTSASGLSVSTADSVPSRYRPTIRLRQSNSPSVQMSVHHIRREALSMWVFTHDGFRAGGSVE